MTTAQNTLIVDDNNEDVFAFSSDSTSLITDINGAYNSTVHTSTDTGNSEFVKISFTGSSIEIYGNTTSPSTDSAQTFMVSIDGGEAASTSYNNPNPPSYRQWYQSPTLSDSAHTITLSNVLQGASIDFAVITTNQTALVDADEPLILDDNNPAIVYSGSSWTTSEETFRLFAASPDTTIVPYGGTSHRATTVGDSVAITVNGPSIGDGFESGVAVFGFVDFTKLGLLNLTFSLDGGDLGSSTFFMNPTDPGFVEGVMEPHFEFIRTPALSSGQHTLVITVAEIDDQSFILDFITTTAFPVLESRSVILPAGRKSRVGAIVGGVIGGIVFLLLAGLLFDFVRLRKQRLRARLIFRNRFFGSRANTNTNTGIPLSTLTHPEHENIE